MPGVLIVEAMAQTGAVAVLSEEENRAASRSSPASTASASSASSSRATSSSSSVSWSGSAARSAAAVRPRRSAASSPRAGTLTFAVERDVIAKAERAAADLDHRLRRLRARARGDERGALDARRHLGRMDHRAHRASASGAWSRPSRRCRTSACRPSPGARAGRRRGEGHRSDRRGDGHAGHALSVHRRAARRRHRLAGRCRVRPVRRLHRLHVRAGAGLRDDRRRPLRARARRRRRRALAHRRLERPRHLRAVRRRRGRGGARARRRGRVPRLRARRGGRRRRAPLPARAAARASATTAESSRRATTSCG